MLSELVDSPASPVIDPDVFDFAMLLLSMQQIGHRLSSELELDALVSAILGTAKEVQSHPAVVEAYLGKEDEKKAA